MTTEVDIAIAYLIDAKHAARDEGGQDVVEFCINGAIKHIRKAQDHEREERDKRNSMIRTIMTANDGADL